MCSSRTSLAFAREIDPSPTSRISAASSAGATSIGAGRLVAQPQVVAGDPVRDLLRVERRASAASVASNRRAASRIGDEHRGVVGGQARGRAGSAARRAAGSSGRAGASSCQPGRVEVQRRQVRLREVAVVVGRLLDPHPVRLAAVVVPAARLLDERLARVERGRLPLDLVRDRALDRAERVHVLDLDARAERLRAARPQRDVRLDAHLAALHGRVRRADRQQQQPQLLGVAAGLLGRADDGLGDDLHQRHAGAVEVDEADLRRRPASVAWSSLAVSSSRWARVMRDRERARPTSRTSAGRATRAAGRTG